jgi:hypothetical protein
MGSLTWEWGQLAYAFTDFVADPGTVSIVAGEPNPVVPPVNGEFNHDRLPRASSTSSTRAASHGEDLANTQARVVGN